MDNRSVCRRIQGVLSHNAAVSCEWDVRSTGKREKRGVELDNRKDMSGIRLC